MRKLVSFIGWIFKKSFKKILEANNNYREFLENETGFAVFIWIMASSISSLIVFLLMGIFVWITGILPPIEILGGYMILCLAYLIYTGFSIMYNNFEAERAEIFNTIKNGK